MSLTRRSFASLAAVLLVAAACSETPTAASLQIGAPAADMRQAEKSIVEIAVGNPDFSTLVAAVTAADLVDALNGKRQLTVFAPTNAAFAALGLNEENIATTLTKEQLTNILLYHVTPGRRASPSVVNVPRITMLNGERTTISRTSEGAQINGANITSVDIAARNGIVHVIDAVLIP